MKTKFLLLALFTFGLATYSWSQVSLNPKLKEASPWYHGKLIVLDWGSNAIVASPVSDEDITKMQENLKIINDNLSQQKQTNSGNKEQLIQLQKDVQSLEKENTELKKELYSLNQEVVEIRRDLEELRRKIK